MPLSGHLHPTGIEKQNFLHVLRNLLPENLDLKFSVIVILVPHCQLENLTKRNLVQSLWGKFADQWQILIAVCPKMRHGVVSLCF